MNKTNNPNLKPYAQTLRREMTKEENRLWYDFLKNQSITFNRQKVIGNYIADFYCASAKLIIELDGSQHYEEQAKIYEENRSKFFSRLGINVIRYSNYEINTNFDGVCKDILKYISPLIDENKPSP